MLQNNVEIVVLTLLTLVSLTYALFSGNPLFADASKVLIGSLAGFITGKTVKRKV